MAFDAVLRPFKEWILVYPAYFFVRMNISATQITLIGGLFGLLAAWSAFYIESTFGFVCANVFWILNRLCDGIDGVVARLSKQQTDFGGYLDLLLDMFVYCALPCGIFGGVSGGQREHGWMILAAYLCAVNVNSASWMLLSGLIEKRMRIQSASSSEDESRNKGKDSSSKPTHLTSLTMPPALAEGLETMIVFTVILFFPALFFPFIEIFTLIIVFSIMQRVSWAVSNLR